MGYIPGSLTVGVWMGNNNQEPMSNSFSGGLFSADGPLYPVARLHGHRHQPAVGLERSPAGAERGLRDARGRPDGEGLPLQRDEPRAAAGRRSRPHSWRARSRRWTTSTTPTSGIRRAASTSSSTCSRTAGPTCGSPPLPAGWTARTTARARPPRASTRLPRCTGTTGSAAHSAARSWPPPRRARSRRSASVAATTRRASRVPSCPPLPFPCFTPPGAPVTYTGTPAIDAGFLVPVFALPVLLGAAPYLARFARRRRR